MTQWINDHPIKHTSSNGTTFTADRADLRNGVTVAWPRWPLSEAQKREDYLEFGTWHSLCIFKQLNGFNGYNCIRFLEPPSCAPVAFQGVPPSFAANDEQALPKIDRLQAALATRKADAAMLPLIVDALPELLESYELLKVAAHALETPGDFSQEELQGQVIDDISAFLARQELGATPPAGDDPDREIIESVMFPDLVGDYDDAATVPEWHWVEKNASFAHLRNGESGIWEFVVNLAMTLDDAPAPLRDKIEAARGAGVGYLLFHQGT